MTWSSILWKAKPSVKKKRLVGIKNILVDQELGTEVDSIQREYINWKRDCGIGLSDIGITGRGHDKEGTTGRDTLLEHVEEHVNAVVQRPNQPRRDGANFTIKLLDEIVLHEESVIEEDDEENLVEFVKDLKGIAGTDSDPRNIKFTQPLDVVKRGKKFIDVGKEPVYGHYRTPIYVESRRNVHGSEKEQDPVDASWYSSDKNSATPPFWQAIFAGSSEGSAGSQIKIGILGILENFQKAVEGAYLNEVIINDTGDFESKINTLTKLTPLKRELMKLIKDKTIYRGNGHQIMYGGERGLVARLGKIAFKGNKLSSKYLAEISEALGDIAGSDDIKQFKIKLTVPTINRLINLWVRGEANMVVPPHLLPNGRPFLLSSAGGGRKTTGQSWSTAHDEAVKRSKEMKKSWVDNLWR